ncbi:MAG: KH domain-containing protein, partial [Acutalibacteraceae bacterium]
MFEQIINVDRMEHAVSLFGSFDENIRLIEEHYGVHVVTRGTDLKISGEPEQVARAVEAVDGLLQLIN